MNFKIYFFSIFIYLLIISCKSKAQDNLNDLKILEKKTNTIFYLGMNKEQIPENILKSSYISIDIIDPNKKLVIVEIDKIIKAIDINFDVSKNFQFEFSNGINKNLTKDDIIKLFGKKYTEVDESENTIKFTYDKKNQKFVESSFIPDENKDKIILIFNFDKNNTIINARIFSF